MSGLLRIENVLIVLSPLSQAFLQGSMAASAALELKELGTTRADLTTDPRLNLQASRHSAAYPVPDFVQAARSLTQDIFRPVLGKSDVQDLSDAMLRHDIRKAPDIFSLSHVGKLFARNLSGKNGEMVANGQDGNHIGMVLYAALHARSYDQKQYTHVLYPDMTGHARKVLSRVFDAHCLPEQDIRLPTYGVTVDLSATRQRIRNLLPVARIKPVDDKRRVSSPMPDLSSLKPSGPLN